MPVFVVLLSPPQRGRLLHGDQHHLMGNMFNLVIFGKMAEEDMGSVGASCCATPYFISPDIPPSGRCVHSKKILGVHSIPALECDMRARSRNAARGKNP